jgi:hypothetical protein
MPLNGFKRDEEATGKAGFLDRASYVTLPKFGEPHVILHGLDKEAQRRALFAREKSICQKCSIRVYWEGPLWQVGEWSHIEDSIGKKCDCLHNAELLCHNCHQGPGSKHYLRRPRLGTPSI